MKRSSIALAKDAVDVAWDSIQSCNMGETSRWGFYYYIRRKKKFEEQNSTSFNFLQILRAKQKQNPKKALLCMYI